MNPATYMPIVFLWLIILVMHHNRSKAITIKKVIEKQKTGGNTEMKELAEKFIDKECVIYSFDSNHQYTGTIKEVTDGAILIDKDGKLEAINLGFVIRIREYPTKKNGKKKTVVLD